MAQTYAVSGVGLGLRRAMIAPLENHLPEIIDFMEVAPENWMGLGGELAQSFRRFAEKTPFVCHGLSLNIGGPEQLDEPFIQSIRNFLDTHSIRCYSEHLTFCADKGHLYDLLPIPFTEEAAKYVAERIRTVQDILGRRIAVENASYYCPLSTEMDELHFINEVLESADCDLLLDINNVYVNSINHGYDPSEFLRGLPSQRIAYGHIAGHSKEEALLIDTHGTDVTEAVWDLLAEAYKYFGKFPTLLERDFNIPPLEMLLAQLQRIGDAQTGERD